MRCYICQKFEYPFQEVFQEFKSNTYSICEKCFMKHPAFIRMEVIPNMFDMIQLIQVIHDGTYPHEAYRYMFEAIFQKIMGLENPFILVFEALEDHVLELLQLLPFGTLWILNIQLQ